MDQQEQSRGGPYRRPLLWAGGIAAALAFLIIVICGYLFGWKWTGLPKRTLWDWLDLLIVPIVLAIGGYLFTRSENRATQAAAERRAQDDTLQAYLDGMSQLLTDEKRPLHRAQPGDSLSTVARARTLTVLSRLDGGRKGSVLEFLYESRLIDREQALLDESDRIEKRHNIVSLEQADLIEASLSGADLSGANLSEANLSGASLLQADLSEASLSALLIEADLSEANLSEASLIEAILSWADLSGANLSGASLSQADLSGADLSEASLSGARGITNEELDQQAASLEGATMPNGQKYEDWLKSKGRGEDGQNSGTS